MGREAEDAAGRIPRARRHVEGAVGEVGAADVAAAGVVLLQLQQQLQSSQFNPSLSKRLPRLRSFLLLCPSVASGCATEYSHC